MLGVHVRLVPHHLHPLAAAALLAAVLADHVQLPDPVLEAEERRGMRYGVGGGAQEGSKVRADELR